MGRVKAWLSDIEEEHAEPCPTDFKTKKECDAFFREYMRKPKLNPNPDPFWTTPRTSAGDGVPMSINYIGDNADAWLDDEPWRKW